MPPPPAIASSPILAAVEEPAAASAVSHRAVSGKQQDTADHRADESCPFARSIETERVPEVRGDDRADDTDQRRHHDPTWIIARHQELRHSADQQTDENDPYQNDVTLPPQVYPLIAQFRPQTA